MTSLEGCDWTLADQRSCRSPSWRWSPWVTVSARVWLPDRARGGHGRSCGWSSLSLSFCWLRAGGLRPGWRAEVCGYLLALLLAGRPCWPLV